jgi:hypothetical protein
MLMGFAKGSTHPRRFNSRSQPESFSAVIIDAKGNDLFGKLNVGEGT